MQQQRALSTPDCFLVAHAEGAGWHWWWFADSSAGRQSRIQAVLRQHAQAALQTPAPQRQPARPAAVLRTPGSGFVRSSELLQPSPSTPQVSEQQPELQPAAGQPASEQPHAQVAWTATVAGACSSWVSQTSHRCACNSHVCCRQHKRSPDTRTGPEAADQRGQRSRRGCLLAASWLAKQHRPSLARGAECAQVSAAEKHSSRQPRERRQVSMPSCLGCFT